MDNEDEILHTKAVKYGHGAKIVHLSPDRYAILGAWSNDEGLPILAIGTWAELEQHFPPEPPPAPLRRSAPQPKVSLDELLSDLF